MATSKAWKSWESKLCKELLAVVGPVTEPGLRTLATSTGRVGHLTSLGFDGLVGTAGRLGLVVEAKRRKMPKWFLEAVAQISEISGQYERIPVIGFSLASDLGTAVVLRNKDGSPKLGPDGKSLKTHKEWAAVPLPVLLDLLKAKMKTL